MIVLVVVNLITAGSVYAGYGAVEENPITPEIKVKQADLERRDAELVKAELVKSSGFDKNPTLPSVSIARNLAYGSRFGGASEVLVIPSTEITTEEIATINEDMNIMSRILEKNLQRDHIDVSSMFIPSTDPFNVVFLGRGKQATQSMYLQGYGALFLMKVDFPLSPGPKVEPEKEIQKDEENVDQVWTQIKEEMSEPGTSRTNKSERPIQEYDAEKVKNLKNNLIQSLIHAANIRSLTSDEWVILTINGSVTSSGYKSVSTIPGRNEFVVVDHHNRTQIIKGSSIGDMGLALPTVLVIRAKKSDIDSFAKGDLDFDQFQQKTQVLTSAYLAGQTGADNMFTGTYFSVPPPRR